MTDHTDQDRMSLALSEADMATQTGDVPIGCIVVDACGNVIGRGRNRREADKDPTAHAEIIALRDASVAAGTWHLCGATVYVTVEPCPMCAGALVNARVRRLVYGCDDLKAGAIRSLYQIASDSRLNHRLEVTSGVLSEACAQRLRAFFCDLRTAARKRNLNSG